MSHSESDRRARKRVSVRVPVSLKSGNGESVTGYTRDLSVNGIFLYTDSKFAEGSELEMVLILPPELTNSRKQWVCCHASVVRVEAGQEPGQVGVAANIRNIATLPEIPV